MPENTAQNPYVNKVVYGNQTLIDLTRDTITAADILSGKTAHDKSGAEITGTCEFDSKTIDANAAASEILLNKTAYVNTVKVTGSMPNNSGTNVTISNINNTYPIPAGYHDGSGAAIIDSTELAKLIARNIRSGVEILGVTGTMSGTEDAYALTTTATPSITSQTILPSGYAPLTSQPIDWETDFTSYYVYDSVNDTYSAVEADSQTGGAPTWQSNTYYAAYTYLAQVTINPIPYAETDNEQGGKTVTIGSNSQS